MSNRIIIPITDLKVFKRNKDGSTIPVSFGESIDMSDELKDLLASHAQPISEGIGRFTLHVESVSYDNFIKLKDIE